MLVAKKLIFDVEDKIVDLLGKDELEVYKQNQSAIHNLLTKLEE